MAGSRILLVDDEPELLETVSVLLKSEGYEVVAESEGLRAMDRLRSLEPFDLVIVDLRMAPVDGLEVIEVARRERPKMDVVVLSAYLDDEMLRKVRALGVSACVKKPFTIEEVLDPIREILVRRTRHGETGPPETPRETPPPSETTHEGWIL